MRETEKTGESSMTGDQVIKTKEELEFAVFCIESLALALHKSPPEVYQMLNRQSSILTDYIIPSYDVLHTQGREYIVNDILEVVRERGLKA
jgi:hypothetical protein